MSNFELVDPQSGFDYDLQSIYSAFIGSFQVNNLPWYERSWSNHFASFEDFLAHSWPAIAVTDSRTGRAHIVTRYSAIDSLLKMIKQRYGETLPIPPNIIRVSPFENSQRPLRHLSDLNLYKKLHATLPAVTFSAFKSRVRSGEPKAIKELWAKKDKTFLAIDFEWSERNPNSCLEWGYAAVRCGHLSGKWPPAPDQNYRRGHYIVSEYVDKVHNKICPTHPWQYAFGESLKVSKNKLPQVIEAVITSLSSPDSDSHPNNLVLVGHGVHTDLKRLDEIMKIKTPHNMLAIDSSIFEKTLYSSGERHPMMDPLLGQVRLPGTTLSLDNLLLSFTMPSTDPLHPNKRQVALPDCVRHNSGNDAFLSLFALQMLLDPMTTLVPTTKRGRIGAPRLPPSTFPGPIVPSIPHPSPGRSGSANKRASIIPPPSNSQLSPNTPIHHARMRTNSGGVTRSHSREITAWNPNINKGGSSVRQPVNKSTKDDLADEFGAMALERKMAASTANGKVETAVKRKSASTANLADSVSKTHKRRTMDFLSSFRVVGK